MKRAALTLALVFTGCSDNAGPLSGTSSFRVEITGVNGAPPPASDAPLPANRGDVVEEWEFSIEARSPSGKLDDFDGLVRLSVEPGTVVSVEAEGSSGRNVRLQNGKATGRVRVTAVYGPVRLWAEDLGYRPAAEGKRPRCADGKNNDPGEDVLIDFPADPGCAFADDDTEQGGTHAAGVSLPVAYALPTLSDVQGAGATTPYPYEGMEINAADPQHLVVTRVAGDGFYVTDLAQKDEGFAHMFAFSFSTPPGMRVCDRVTYLAGTVVEFFGFTELSFPSFRLQPVFEGEPCLVPAPVSLEASVIADDLEMEKLESSLVRLENFRIASNFGPKPAHNNVFGPDQSSCDLNGDGTIDFMNAAEASCANACSADPSCSEWTGFVSRGNYKVALGSTMMQINTGTVPTFDAPGNRGQVLTSVTGTMRNFSGGKLNWTVETRCADDLVCEAELGCPTQDVMPSDVACVRLRTLGNTDEGTD